MEEFFFVEHRKVQKVQNSEKYFFISNLHFW